MIAGKPQAGGAMGEHDWDGPRDQPAAGVSDHRVRAARDRLNEAVAELRRLTREEFFVALDRLADVGDVGGLSGVSAESVRRLRLWSAEHLRLATELEAAARCCRLIEHELRQQLDMLLADSQEPAETEGDLGTDKPTGVTHRLGLTGWLKTVSRRAGAVQGPLDADDAAAPAVSQRLPMPSVVPPLPLPRRSEADVVALMLGPFELEVSGRRVVRWSSLKARAVFQYLLIHYGRPVRRDVLMELQWPNHSPTSARNNLNVALYSLRNTLDGRWRSLQPILYQDGCYLLNPELTWWMDRDEFLSALNQAQLARASGHTHQAVHHYQRAVRVYRGPLFEDDNSGDWYLPEQRHLTGLYLGALENLGEIYFDRGELTSAESFSQLALRCDPCCEPAHRLLMRCYASGHRQQLVTRQYRLCVSALHDELGVSPDAETLRLFRDLTSATP